MSGFTNNAAYISGVNERPYMTLLQSLIKPDIFFINVGANVGYLSLWLCQNDRSICGVAFEPEPDTYRQLQTNISLNGFPIEPFQFALGDFDGSARLSSGGPGDGAAHIVSADELAVDISVMRLDSFKKTKRTAWIILDVEGFAGRVLRGARDVITSDQPNVALEIHSAEEASATTSIMTSLNYRQTHALNSLWGVHQIWQPNL